MNVVELYCWFMMIVSFRTVCHGLMQVTSPSSWRDAWKLCRSDGGMGKLACLSIDNDMDIAKLEVHQSVWIGTYTTLSSWFKEDGKEEFIKTDQLNDTIRYKVKTNDTPTCQLLCNEKHFIVNITECICFMRKPKTEKNGSPKHQIYVKEKGDKYTDLRQNATDGCRYLFCKPGYVNKGNIVNIFKKKSCTFNTKEIYVSVCESKNNLMDCQDYSYYKNQIYSRMQNNQNMECKLYSIHCSNCDGSGEDAQDLKAEWKDKYRSGIGFKFSYDEHFPPMKCFKGTLYESGNGIRSMKFTGTTDCSERYMFFCSQTTQRIQSVCDLTEFAASKASSTAGATAGIAVGVCILVIAIAVVMFILWRRHKQKLVKTNSKDRQFIQIVTTTPSCESPPQDQPGSEYDFIKEPGEYQTIEANGFTHVDSDCNDNVASNKLPVTKGHIGKMDTKQIPPNRYGGYEELELDKEPNAYLTIDKVDNVQCAIKSNDLPENYFVLEPSNNKEGSRPDNYFILEPPTDDKIMQFAGTPENNQESLAKADPGYELQRDPNTDSKSNASSSNARSDTYSLAVNVDNKQEETGYEKPLDSQGNYFILETEKGDNQFKTKSENDYVDSAESEYDRLHGKTLRKPQTNQDHMYAHTHTVDNKDVAYDTANRERPYKRDSTYDTTKDMIGDDTAYDTTRGNHGNEPTIASSL